MRYFLPLWMIVWLISSLSAQSNKFRSGEILLRNGIQKTGFVFGQFHLAAPKGVYFKASETEKTEYVEFKDIQEVQFGSTERYLTHCTQNTAQQTCHWLKTLLLGKISLHQSVADGGLYFMQEAGTFNAIRSPSFEGLLALLKRKCPTFTPPASTKFSTETLIQTVVNYNQCQNPGDQAQALYIPEEPAQWFIGPKLGFNLSGASIYELNYYGRGKYTASPSITAGLSAQIGITEHWSAGIDLLYYQQAVKSDSVNVWDVTSPNYSKINVDLSFVEIPFYAQYYFSGNKIKPFIQAGAHLGIPIKRTFQQEMFNATPSEIDGQPGISFLGPGVGFGGGVGLKTQLNDRSHLQVLGQYTQYATTFVATSSIFGGNDDSFTETPIRISRFQLALSYLIRL